MQQQITPRQVARAYILAERERERVSPQKRWARQMAMLRAEQAVSARREFNRNLKQAVKVLRSAGAEHVAIEILPDGRARIVQQDAPKDQHEASTSEWDEVLQ